MTLDFFRYREVLPHPGLKDIVTHYRVKQARLSEPFIFPNYSPIFQGLIFNISPLDDIVLAKKEDISLRHKVYFVGQAISPGTLFSSTLNLDLIAVNFTPTGVFQLTGIHMSDFTDQIIDAELLFGKEIDELYDKITSLKDSSAALGLIDSFLCHKARNQKKENKSCILTSLSILKKKASGVTVRMLQKAANASSKTLERSFKSEIGMSPKMYQRLLRYNQARHYIEQYCCTDWREIVVPFGFYDQSHFISEFRFFSGKTPIQYASMLPYGINR